MSNMKFIESDTPEYLNNIQYNTQKPEIVLIDEDGIIKARFKNWDNDGYNYSLFEIDLLLEMLTKTKDTIIQLTKESQSDAQQRTEQSSGENSTEPGSRL